MEGEKSVDPLTGEAGRPSVDEEAAKRKKIGRKKLVDDTANQAKKLEEHPVWKAARHGSAAEFRRAVAATPNFDPFEQGAFGENVLHIATLYSNDDVARYLCDTYPALINSTYMKQPYLGEAAIHIAIVHADLPLVEYLLSKNCELNEVRCVGEFFRPPTGSIYLGEVPLTFAACMEHPENRTIVRMLLRAGARLDTQDSRGNTVLHLLVIHDNLEMYNYIMNLFDLYRSQYTDDLEQIRNDQGRTPLALAAALGREKMLEGIIDRRKVVLWTYGPVMSCAYPLEEIDTYRTDRGQKKSILELIVYLSGALGNTLESERQRAALLNLTPMWELVQLKWRTFAAVMFYSWFLTYMLYLAALTIAATRPSSLLNDDGTAGIGLAVCEIIVLVGAFVMMTFEALDILRLRRRYFSEKGSRLFFLINWVYNLLIVAAFICRLVGDPQGEVVCVACAVVFGYMFALYFARGFQTFGYFVVMLREMILGDLARFIVIYLVALISFAVANMVLFRDASIEAFDSVPRAMYTMFNVMIFNFDSLDVLNTPNNGLAVALFFGYLIMTSILLLNMLIAMMNDTYSEIRPFSEQQWRLEYVSIILLLERRLPLWIVPRFRSGKPGSALGRSDEKWYLVLERKVAWQVHTEGSRLALRFKQAVRRIIYMIRLGKITGHAGDVALSHMPGPLSEKDKTMRQRTDKHTSVLLQPSMREQLTQFIADPRAVIAEGDMELLPFKEQEGTK